MSSQLVSLILFSTVASLTPGPNNIMTSYTAFNFGLRKTIPTMLGVIIGWTILVIILLISSSFAFQKFEKLQLIIKILGSFYLVFIAYKISFIRTKNEKNSPKPVTFLNTFFFQFINPKSIIIALTAISMFVDTQNNFYEDSIVLIGVFFIMAVGSQAAWCLMGKYLRKFATSAQFIQNFNFTMSFLLIVCVIMFYV